MANSITTISATRARLELGAAFWRGLGGILARALVGLHELATVWRERVRQRRQLMTLDERLLRDIGIRREDAESEWRKPFWRP